MLEMVLLQSSTDLILVITAIIAAVYTGATVSLVIQTKKFGTSQLESQKELSRLQLQTLIITEMGKIDQLVNDPTALNERKIVLNHYTGVEINGNILEVSERVSGLLDRIGALVSVSNELRAEYLRLHSEKTGKSWMALRQYVLDERKEDRRDDPDFRKYFQEIGEQSEAYYNEHHDNRLALKKKLAKPS